MPSPTDLQSALTVIAIIAAQCVSSWWLNRGVKAEARKATEASRQTGAETVATGGKVDEVHATLNGQGVMGALTRIDGRLDDHDRQLADIADAMRRGIVIQPAAPEAK